jgi:hypothetical protein
MQLETKFLRLQIAVTLGSRFGDWQVCWVGGWNKHRIGFMVMVVRVGPLGAGYHMHTDRLIRAVFAARSGSQTFC